ncbi:MAG: type I-U CRISPR-associated protein Cas8c [Planctomycetes bacterium]|nr:type I-U CRISPR-associated protein Cas8c [Planctomycetota bacterium]
MTNAEPAIQIPVDLTNPGQFFACCGLLELADRLWPNAEIVGEFSRPTFERSQFSILSKSTISTHALITALCSSTRRPVDPYRPIKKDGKLVNDIRKIKPIRIDVAKTVSQQYEPVTLRLSWWLDELAGQQVDDFKLWSAHPSSKSLIDDMINAIKVDEIREDNLLDYSVGMTGRIGLDVRSSWNALDEGFSPNNQNLPVETYPATELLAAVGLQNFAPISEDNAYVYVRWNSRLPPSVARAAVCGCIALPGSTRYRFHIGKRGRFKYFTRASKVERTNNV